jgi:hypothetical protein
MDVAFGKPADYFAVPDAERVSRCALTRDWCVIDEQHFYIRGCLYVPVTDANEQFAWGLWARIAEPAFQRYHELYSADGSQEPAFQAFSVASIAATKGLMGGRLRSSSARPASGRNSS